MQAAHSFLWVSIGFMLLIHELPQKINVGMSVTHVQSIPHKTDLRAGLIRVSGYKAQKSSSLFPIKH